jgi:processive 1,2-diacylglycerol beta-glucosyltransferase
LFAIFIKKISFTIQTGAVTMEKQKVLILTASYGNGHIQVAKTLKEECHKQGINEVIISNLFAEAHPLVNDITEYLYLKSYTIGKPLYRFFYYGMNKMYHTKILNWYYNFGKKRLISLIEAERPDFIINTFPMIVVPEFRRRSGIFIPIFNVLTDYCLHKIWLHPEIDKYYVATEDLKQKIVDFGIPESIIETTGIPIRPVFEEQILPSSLFKKYHLSPAKKVIVIMAGAHGVLKNVKEICETLLTQTDSQIVVVCGNNTSLMLELEPLTKKFPDPLRVFGYLERVDELFRITTCMITKPGGITLTEAAALGVPLILYKPVPGQEKENAQYFASKGGAVIANQLEDIYMTISYLLNNEEALLEMKNAMRQIYKPHSAKNIIHDISNTVEQLKLKRFANLS